MGILLALLISIPFEPPCWWHPNQDEVLHWLQEHYTGDFSLEIVKGECCIFAVIQKEEGQKGLFIKVGFGNSFKEAVKCLEDENPKWLLNWGVKKIK